MASNKPSSSGGIRRTPLLEVSPNANTCNQRQQYKLVCDDPTDTENRHTHYLSDDRSTIPKTPVPVRAALIPPPVIKRNSASSYSSRAGPPAARPVKTHIGPWQLGSTISQGSTCTVRMVRHARTGEIAVAKVISKVTADKVRARSLANLCQRMERGGFQFTAELKLPVGLEREIVIMRLLRHPNIVRLYDVWENSNEIYLIMENVQGGELFQHIADNGPLNEKEAVFLFRQLVEALLYCHRLQIFHRDLKPENILIEKGTMTIKVIDFGMAAYQPTGDLLKTPCGSPHYAAPELLEGHAYDGSQADVWSLSVVFFVMLTNGLPFNFPSDLPEESKLKGLYEEIKACKIKLPSWLSKEAKDLFRRAFIRDPEQRISITGLWEHPLLHKYDKTFRYEGRCMEDWIGPAPTIENWVPLSPELVDRHIFRHLRTLWHDIEEPALIRKLCSPIINQEKYFYHALAQYREEQLDSMDHSPARSGIVISESDYHHSHGKESHKRGKSSSGSQFSIFHQEHIKSKHSFFDEPTSDGSHDPFKSHGEQVIVVKSQQGCSNMLYSTSEASRPLKHGTVITRKELRIETLKRRSSKRVPATGLRSASIKEFEADSLSTTSKRSKGHSRTSTNSSHWLGNRSPIAVIKPSERHKKNVSFDHKRRRSATSNNVPQTVTANTQQEPSLPAISSGLQLSDIPSSPPLPAPVGPTPRTKRVYDIDIAARKVSNELEKACEEAFFRSSASDASFRSSTSDAVALAITETPPSSVSNRSTYPPRDARTIKAMLNRPLPPTPVERNREISMITTGTAETPGTYTTRELQEMRQRLALRYEKDGASNKKHFNEILRQLDSLMPPGSPTDKRFASPVLDPLYFSSNEDLNLLQPIPEEGRILESEELLAPVDTPVRTNKRFSHLRRRDSDITEQITDGTTIRVVEPSSPGSPSPWAPLNVRKTSSGSGNSPTIDQENRKQSAIDTSTPPRKPGQNAFQVSNLANNGTSRGPWWRRTSNQDMNSKEKASNNVPQVSPSSEWEDLDDRTSRRNERTIASHHKNILGLSNSNCGEFTDFDSTAIDGSFLGPSSRYYRAKNGGVTYYSGVDIEGEGELKKSGFFRGLFRKKTKPVYGVDRNMSTNFRDAPSKDWESRIATGPFEKMKAANEWNLLDRLLRIKPESRVLILCHPRKVARNLLCGILFQESGSGITDIVRDESNRNSFTCVMDKDNKWSLKSVSFAVEFFSILRDGKRSKLTAVRFTQTRGSGPALRRLVELLSQHLENGHLHADPKETKEIVKLIQTGRVEND